MQLPPRGERLTPAVGELLARFWDEYLLFGGFPGVVAKASVEEKRQALTDIFSSYWQLEVLQFGDFRKTDVMRDLMLLLLQRVGSKLDIQKVASELGVSRPTIYEYLGFLTGTYFITLLPPYSKKVDGRVRGAEKVYAIDSGLVTAMVDVSEGQLFEQSVHQLLRAQGELSYYQRRGGAELDFIVDGRVAYEVKLTASSRDVQRVQSLARDLDLDGGYIVARQPTSLDGVLPPFVL